MEKQLRKFIRKEILKEVSALGAIASEAGQVSVNIDGWELPPGGFKPIENVVDTLKLQLLDQQERVENMGMINSEKIPDDKYKKVSKQPSWLNNDKYDEVQKQTKEFVGKYTNKTSDMKLIGESTMKISENKLRSLIRQEIVNLVSEENSQIAEAVPRQFKSGKPAEFGASFGAKDRGAKVGKRSVTKKVKGSGKATRGKKPGGVGPKGASRSWTYRPVVKGGEFERGGAKFTPELDKGGEVRVKMEEKALAKAKEDTGRWNDLLQKAQKAGDKSGQEYFELQIKLNDPDKGLYQAMRTEKWSYVEGSLEGNTAKQTQAIDLINELEKARFIERENLAKLSKNMNWDAYDTGGKGKGS